MLHRVTTVILAMVTIVLVSCGSNGGPVSPAQPQQIKLTAISVTPSKTSLPIGRVVQFSALGTYSDGSTHNISSEVAWHSSSTNVGAISITGMLAPLAAGTTSIAATASGVTGSATVTVTPATIASLSLTCANTSIAYGTKEQCAALGTFTDGTTQNISGSVTWSSSQPGVATVNGVGIVSGLAAGSTVITASSGSVSSSVSLKVSSALAVSLSVAPSNMTMPIGVVRQFAATAKFSDGSTQDITLSAAWSSSNTAVATVQGGTVISIATGTTTISASFETVNNSTALTVTVPALVSIAITPASPQIALGTSLQLSATGTYDNGSTQNITNKCIWTSSSTLATVSNGTVKSQAPGITTISASIGSVTGNTALNVSTATLTAIYVTPATPTIGVGASKSFFATGKFSDGTTQSLTTQVAWSSSSTAVATMSGSTATGVGPGTTTIAAAFTTLSGAVVSGSTSLAVSNATLTSLSISPASAAISAGQSQQFLITAHYSDGTTQTPSNVVWTSSNTTVATINSNWAFGIQAGTTTITATYNSLKASAVLNVGGGTLESIFISPSSATIATSTKQQFTATGSYSDGSTRNLNYYVTWTSSDYNVATVSNIGGASGVATGVSPGNVVIGAMIGSVVGAADLTVTNATLTEITISPQSSNISTGTNQNFRAMGTFSDGTVQNITSSVTWSSSDPAVATINSAGTAASVSAGTSTITASANGVTGTATLTVY